MAWSQIKRADVICDGATNQSTTSGVSDLQIWNGPKNLLV
jgi:hypothetical protein